MKYKNYNSFIERKNVIWLIRFSQSQFCFLEHNIKERLHTFSSVIRPRGNDLNKLKIKKKNQKTKHIQIVNNSGIVTIANDTEKAIIWLENLDLVNGDKYILLRQNK